MLQLLLQVLITLIIAGFFVWAARALINALGAYIAEPFLGLINVLIIIVAVAIVIFGAVIPLLHAISGVSIPGLH